MASTQENTTNYKDILFKIIKARIVHGGNVDTALVRTIDKLTETEAIANEFMQWVQTSDEFED